MVGGTAAGLVDATTGEGILEAAMTGRFAAAAGERCKSRQRGSCAGLRSRHETRLLFALTPPCEADGIPRTQARALRRALPATRGRAAIRRPLAARSQRFHAGPMAVFIRTGTAFWGPRGVRRLGVIAFAVDRLVRLVLVLLAITLVSFLFLHLIPGDPIAIRLGEHASPQQIAFLTHEYGLDRPWWVQLGKYLVALAHGDLGISISDTQPVAQKLALAFPATVELTFGAMLVAIVIGIPARRAGCRAPAFVPRCVHDERGARRRIDPRFLARLDAGLHLGGVAVAFRSRSVSDLGPHLAALRHSAAHALIVIDALLAVMAARHSMRSGIWCCRR